MTPNIPLLTPHYPPQPGGVAHSCRRMAEMAAATGYEVHVAWVRLDLPAEALPLTRIQTEHQGPIAIHTVFAPPDAIPQPKGLWGSYEAQPLGAAFQALQQLCHANHFALIQVWYIYPLAYLGLLLAHLYDSPLLLCFRGSDVTRSLLAPSHLPLLTPALLGASRVVSVANDLIQMADAVVPIRAKSQVIHNSVELPDPIPPRALPAQFRDGWICCSGQFKRKKGLSYLFQALHNLIERGCDFGLLLVGAFKDGQEALHLDLLERLRLRERTTITGWLSREQALGYVRAADIFALPSLEEGCPNGLLEACKLGLPVIATRSGAVAELLTHGKDAWLVPPGDVDGLAEGIAWMIDHRAEAAEMGRWAKDTVGCNSLDWEQQQWAAVYRSMLA